MKNVIEYNQYINYNDFKSNLSEGIIDYLKEHDLNYEVNLKKTPLNNNTHQDVIVINNAIGCLYTPMFFVKEFYDQYTSGTLSFSECVEAIVNQSTEDFKRITSKYKDVSAFDYEHMKDNIIIAVSSNVDNDIVLSEQPHIIRDDLGIAITFKLDFEDGCYADITKKIISAWKNHENSKPMSVVVNISEEDLYTLAKKNTIEKYPLFVKGTINENMFIITNNSAFGSSVLLYSEDLEKIGSTIGNYTLLPVSTREILVVGRKNELSIDELEEHLKIANSELRNISPESVLTDSVLVYNAEKKELSINENIDKLKYRRR